MIIRHPARTSWSRRDVLRGSAAALMGAYGLAPRYGLAADIPMEYDGSKFQIAAPEPNPKRGGVMRYGILNRPSSAAGPSAEVCQEETSRALPDARKTRYLHSRPG